MWCTLSYKIEKKNLWHHFFENWFHEKIPNIAAWVGITCTIFIFWPHCVIIWHNIFFASFLALVDFGYYNGFIIISSRENLKLYSFPFEQYTFKIVVWRITTYTVAEFLSLFYKKEVQKEMNYQVFFQWWKELTFFE